MRWRSWGRRQPGSRPGPAQRRHREGGQRPDHLGDARDGALLEPAGRHGMSDAVCRCSQACQKSITSVSGDRVSRKVQLSAAPSAIATIPISGRARLMCDFACKLRLQRELAALRHAAEIEGLQALALGVVEGDRAAGGLAPGGLGATVLAGSQRHHDAVEGDRGGGRVLRPRPHGLPSEAFGLRVRRCGCSPTASWRRSSQRTPPLPGPCSDPSSADELGRRPRQVIVDEAQALVDRHRRCPARAAAVTRSPVGHRTERGHDRLRRHRDPEPAIAGTPPRRPRRCWRRRRGYCGSR